MKNEEWEWAECRTDVPEDDAVLGARDLDGRLDGREVTWRERDGRRLLDESQVAERRELERHVLQRVVRAVHHEHVEHDVELRDRDLHFGQKLLEITSWQIC